MVLLQGLIGLQEDFVRVVGLDGFEGGCARIMDRWISQHECEFDLMIRKRDQM
jgi:hypothetical protein